MDTDGKKHLHYKYFFCLIGVAILATILTTVAVKQNKKNTSDNSGDQNNATIAESNFIPNEKTNNNNQAEPKNNDTLIIDYNPLPDAATDYQQHEGSCQAGSAYSIRQDIYSCKSGIIEFDACFKLIKENYYFCGVNPIDKESGVIFKATELLPALDKKNTGQNGLILIELEDGGNCTPMGKVNLSIETQRAKYQCGNGTAVFDEPMEKDGKLIVGISKLIETEGGNWKIESTTFAAITTAWK